MLRLAVRGLHACGANFQFVMSELKEMLSSAREMECAKEVSCVK